MRNLLFLLLFFCTIFPNSKISAQYCAMETGEIPEFDATAFRAFQQKRAAMRNPPKVSLGITIHIVEQVQGAANIDIQTLYDELDAVNRFYSSSGIQFFYCGAPRFIQGKGIYTYAQAATELNRSKHILNTINIFYLDEIGDQQLSQVACGISQFPWRAEAKDRFIIMQKNCSTNGAVLAHELGHFFGLLHTHETANGFEFVDGSNCSDAGDLVCDTPADPNVSRYSLDGCNFATNVVDQNGDLYKPFTANIMSYAPASCQNRFTAGQNERMYFFYESTDLNELISDCDFYPDYAIDADDGNLRISSGQTLPITYEFDNQGITDNQEVALFWILSEEGKQDRIIQKEVLQLEAGSGKITKTFNIGIPLSLGTGTYVLTASLDPDSKILERDKRNNFHVITLTVDNSQFDDVVLFPNPTVDRLKVFVRNKTNGGKITIEIVDHLGRVYYQEKKFKNDEEFFAEISTGLLPAGLYILNLRYDRDGTSQPFLFLKE